MKIVFGNQKGGTGKSTLCILLANYLSLSRQEKVLVLDLDLQGTIADKRVKDSHVNDTFPYPVLKMDISEYSSVSAKLPTDNTYILMDLPGNLENLDLKHILADADYIICPFEYEFGSYVSTLDFRDLCHRVAPNKQINFIPNKVQASVKYETKSVMHGELSLSGNISEAMPNRVFFQRITTFQTNEEETKHAKELFGFLHL